MMEGMDEGEKKETKKCLNEGKVEEGRKGEGGEKRKSE